MAATIIVCLACSKAARKDALEKEKRDHDFFGMDMEGNIYLILQETDREGAKLSCDRFAKKLERIIEGQKISFSMATFPEDGESSEELFREVQHG